MRLPIRVILGTGVLAAILLAGGVFGRVSTANAATSGVSIKNFRFTPATVNIKVGETVRWINDEATTAHDVTSESAGGFGSKKLQPGDSYFQTFPTEGAYNYYCTIHPNMRAVILVGNATGAPSTPPPATPTATPRPPATGSGALDEGSRSWSTLAMLAGAVLAAAAGGALLFARRRAE